MEEAVLKDRVAIIAGAGRGIGRAIALEFATQGASLVLASRTKSELEQTAAMCRDLGGQAFAVVTDVSDGGQTDDLAATAIREAGQIDVLVNSAGVYGPIGDIVDIDVADWIRAVEVNLFGPLHLLRAVLPHMIRRQRGKVIMLGGGGATAPLPAFSSYAASKAGLARLAETVACEVEASNIQINVVAPGLVDTKLQDDVLEAGSRAGPLFEKIKGARESGDGAVPPSVAAGLAVFLASDASGVLTGKLIAAPHDPWREWAERGEELNATPMFTLRRLDPFTIRPLINEL